MLSRSAENLYWMSRYIERAENTARLLDLSYRMSLMPAAEPEESLYWRPAIEIGNDPAAFGAQYGEASQGNVLQFTVLDRSNPSSVYSCIRAAHENALAERTRIGSEMWEALKETWLAVADLDGARLDTWGLRAFFDWVKSRSHLFRGATVGTALQDDAFHFIRIGTFIERADGTARILDMKYHVLLPSGEQVGGSVDYYQWGALLRSVGAFRAYRNVYRREIAPWRVAELLILHPAFPRSLAACLGEVDRTLGLLAPSERLECVRLAGELCADLRCGKIDDIFRNGLHEFLADFIGRNNRLAGQLQGDFMMSSAVE